MPTRRGRPYLLGESNTPMDPQQVIMMFADIQAKLETLTQTINQSRYKLGRVETRLKNCNVLERKYDPLTPY